MKRSKPIAYLYHSCKKSRVGIVLLALLQIFQGFSSVLFAMLMRSTIDHAVSGQRAIFWRYAALLALVVAMQILAGISVRYVGELCRSRIENVLKDELFSTLLCKSYADVTRVHSGEWLNRLTSDTQIAASGVVDIFPPVAGLLVRLIAAVTAILMLEYRFIYVIVPGGIALTVISALLRKKLKELHKAIQEADGALRVLLQERLGSLMMVKAFSAEEATEEEAREMMGRHRAARMRRSAFSIFGSTGLSAAMNAAYLLGFVYCGVGLVNGTVSYGTMTAMLSLISQVQSPFANLSGYVPRYYAMIASTERLLEAKDFHDEERSSAGDGRFRRIVFQNVSFSYPGKEPEVLHGFSYEIRPGDSIAVTGHSGCGKSTVFRLLLSLYAPNQGEILVEDGSGSHRLSADDRRLFAYVPQGNQLMKGSIRDVICFHHAYDEARMRQALSLACADEFVQKLPQGIETQLGERGAGLSEGQMQRISIARALYAGSPILLLDEATSALDEQTEQQLLKKLQDLSDRTVLIVTHRPAALEVCGRRVDME